MKKKMVSVMGVFLSCVMLGSSIQPHTYTIKAQVLKETKMQDQSLAKAKVEVTGKMNGISYHFNPENGELTFTGTGELVSDLFVREENFDSGYYPYELDGEWRKKIGSEQVKSVVISEGITKIGRGIFVGLPNLERVTLPDSLVEIEKYSFSYSTKLKSVKLGRETTTIGEGAFEDCSGLTEITLGQKVEKLGERWNALCPQLEHIFIDENNPNFKTVNGSLYSADETILYRYSEAETGSAVFSPNVKEIATEAFANTQVTEIEVPASVEKLQYGAFYAAKKVQKISLANNRNIDKLKSYMAPYGNDSDFHHMPQVGECSELTELNIGEEVEKIPLDAFLGCKKLGKIYLGKKFVKFAHVDGWCEFSDYNLQEITVSSENPYYSSVNGVCYSKDKKILKFYPRARETSSFKVLDSVEKIDAEAFKKCKNLTTVTLGKNTKTIGKEAFFGAKKLTTVKGSKVLRTIKKEAFHHCVSLKSFAFDKQATDIYLGDDALGGCKKLEKIVWPKSFEYVGYSCLYGTSLKTATISTSKETDLCGTFLGCKKLEKVYVFGKVTELDDTFRDCKSLKYLYLDERVTKFKELYLKSNCPDVKIYGKIGSRAQTYAEKHEIKFVAKSKRM